MAKPTTDINFKKLRLQLGLTQQALADLLDVSVTAVSHYETGARLPTIELAYKFLRIARRAGIHKTLEYIFPPC